MTEDITQLPFYQDIYQGLMEFKGKELTPLLKEEMTDKVLKICQKHEFHSCNRQVVDILLEKMMNRYMCNCKIEYKFV